MKPLCKLYKGSIGVKELCLIELLFIGKKCFRDLNRIISIWMVSYDLLQFEVCTSDAINDYSLTKFDTF